MTGMSDHTYPSERRPNPMTNNTESLDYDKCELCGAPNNFCMCLDEEDSCEYCGAELGTCSCEYVDCGMGPDGQCSKAGSEECDWDCGGTRQ